ncbi:MAG: GWxTD domain-containing protein [Thermoanaerobaculia bacterium]|nr:GWxTD domain-containing protein [Thermoanaerobaculia bacterium]
MVVSPRWWLALVLAGALGAQEPPAEIAPATAAPAGETAPAAIAGEKPVDGLPERHARWLVEVEPLITGPEKELFLGLQQDYQRDAFIQEFWKVRDPYPRTARNELKERWPERLALARSRFGSLDDDRARVLLIHGEPSGGFEVRCTTTRVPVEIWGYRESPVVNFPFAVVFVREKGTGPARVWRPTASGIAADAVIANAQPCINGSRMVQILAQLRAEADNYERTLSTVLAKPRPRSEEWIYAFVAHTTDVAPGTEPLPVALDVGFLGRHQNRTVVQAVLDVPVEATMTGEFAGYSSYDFLLTGDVIADDRLFETFRYKFGLPAQEVGAKIPLAFQRFLRPGKYRWVLKIEDLNSKRATHLERVVEVPPVEGFVEVPEWKDPETAKLFAEATAAIASGETGIRIIPPQGDVLTGFVRFDTLVSGDQIQKVLFYLDDKQILARNRPPWNVEIDLGPFPDLRTLRVEGLDEHGQEVASDQLLINSGDYRFSIRLLEPRRGQTYVKSLRARVEVQVPEDRTLDHVELYLNETKVATLYQEPFVQPILLPEKAEVAYVRAVAYLPDGNSTEDVVFINAPDYVEAIDVQFVELYTTVIDGAGRPIEGLTGADFQVWEDGTRQKIARFEQVENLPIHVGILIDNSASMFAAIEEVKKAALSFFSKRSRPKTARR